jgi:hypothetical protein
MMHLVMKGVTRDQFMARHKANHIQVVYAPDAAGARKALYAKAAMKPWHPCVSARRPGLRPFGTRTFPVIPEAGALFASFCERSVFHIPPTQIDPPGLPPLIMASEPGSFARHTMQVRVPAIVRETSALNEFPAEIRAALDDLAHEIESGPVRPLEENTPDRTLWQAAWNDYTGRAWLDTPWYLAESYAYRRILEATRYFAPGAWQGFDPFRVRKQAELKPDAAPRLVNDTLRDAPADLREHFEALLYASLGQSH